MEVDGVQDLILSLLDTSSRINMMALEKIVLVLLCVQDTWICIQRRGCPVYKAGSALDNAFKADAMKYFLALIFLATQLAQVPLDLLQAFLANQAELLSLLCKVENEDEVSTVRVECKVECKAQCKAQCKVHPLRVPDHP
jgi:hypothetical protein